jgi:maltose O-acetyltransferase
VAIHPHSHIGARTIVLAGVEIGPRTIVGAGSVVTRSLPPDTVCAGNPAKVICSLEEYLDRHREQMRTRPTFPYADYEIRSLSPDRRAELVAAVADGDAYLTGGWTSVLQDQGNNMQVTEFKPGDVVARHQASIRSGLEAS